MKNKKGFTILEVLIAIFISIILMAAVYYTYSTFFMGIKSERVNVEQEIEKIVGLELLRLDLEHLGYGVGINPSGDYKIYELDNTKDISSGKPYLLIRATLNNSNDSTIGWRLCRDKKEIKTEIEGSNSNFVFIDDKGYVSCIKKGSNSTCVLTSDSKCPDANGIFVGYPFDDNAIGCNFNGYNFCSEIKYYLSNSNLPKDCNPNTYNLLRKVNNGTGQPLLSCVADIKFTVDMDTDGDGKINLKDVDDISTYTTDKLRTYTKKVNVYILYQEATPSNPNYKFTDYQTDSSGNYIDVEGIKLYLPSNFEKYKWKAIKISVKPMSIIR